MLKKSNILFITTILVLAFNSLVSAQSPVLVKDVNKVQQVTGVLLGEQSGSKFFFSRTTPESGWEIWVTDTTAAGTHLVKDIVPGSESSLPFNFVAAKKGGVDVVYFTAATPANGRELWISDGTESGTLLVEDIAPGPESSEPEYITVLQGTSLAMFSAYNPTSGREVWYTEDGTAVNTNLLSDVRPGANGSEPKEIKVIFAGITPIAIWSADDGTHGREPWKYAGATSILLDINPGIASSEASGFTLNGSNSKFYFTASRAAEGSEIWSTDFATTSIVKDIVSGTGSSKPSFYQNINSTTTLFFVQNTNVFQLWKTDGTNLGTTLVYEFANSFPFPALFNSILGGSSLGGIKGFFNPIAVNNGKVYFFVTNALNFLFDLTSLMGELWVSDGTPAGTMQITDLYPGVGGTLGLNMASVGSSLVTLMNNGSQGIELWKTQGSVASTTQIADLNPGLASFTDFQFGNFGGIGGFVAGTTGILAQGNVGLSQKIIYSDGTPENTREIADVTDTTTNKSSNPFFLAGLGTKALFSADDATIGSELYITDSTTSTTQLLKDINPFNSSFITQSQTFKSNNKTLFIANDFNTGNELWITDGTAENTKLLKDIYPGPTTSIPTFLNVELNGEIYFAAADEVNGYELWASNGTPEGTRLVKDINPGTTGTNLNEMVVLGNKIYFTGSDSTSGDELWVTDGTTSGTQLLADIFPGASSSDINNLTVHGSNIFFSANNGTNGGELWKSDGTTLGTFQVKDIRPGATGSSIVDIVSFGNAVFFGATDGTTGSELWTSDGTSANTVLVKDIKTGSSGSSARGLSVIGNHLVFIADDGVSGSELWTSQGTTATTTLLKDIRVGSSGSDPSDVFPFPKNSFGVFTAYDPTTGKELWKTDGTSEGTVLVGDFVSGTTSSNPANFLAVNGNLYFTMDKDKLGVEPWYVTLDQCPDDLTKLTPGLCGCGAVDSSSDQDSDGTLDCNDSCPVDPAKVVAGTCGCGNADSDLNANLIVDCLSGTDLKAQIKALQKGLSGLKPAKNKKQLKKLRAKAKLVKKQLTALINFSKSNSARITISGKVSLAKLVSLVKKDVSLALKLKSSLAKDSAKGRKTLGKLAKVVL